MTARFPLANADRPLPIDNSAEVNTNLFWKWTISNQYFCHTNWDYFGLGDDWRLGPQGGFPASPYVAAEQRQRRAPRGESKGGAERPSSIRLISVSNWESEDGKFYRVGTWYSLSEGKGGLANFKRYATAETLVLI